MGKGPAMPPMLLRMWCSLDNSVEETMQLMFCQLKVNRSTPRPSTYHSNKSKNMQRHKARLLFHLQQLESDKCIWHPIQHSVYCSDLPHWSRSKGTGNRLRRRETATKTHAHLTREWKMHQHLEISHCSISWRNENSPSVCCWASWIRIFAKSSEGDKSHPETNRMR